MKDPLPQGEADPRRVVPWIAAAAVLALVLTRVRPSTLGTIVVMVSLILMIMLHELGHFVMAKRAGMKVTEFFLGFGPRLWSVRRGETEYGIKAIPAGGYVRIIGMSNIEEVDPADEERTYRAKPYRHRLGVAVAGSTMHFLIALVLMFAVFGFTGIRSARPVVQQVVPQSPAARVGFHEGDRIVAIDDHPIRSWQDVPDYVQQRPGQAMVFTVERDGRRLTVPVTPERRRLQSGRDGGFVGVGPQLYLKTESVPHSARLAVTSLGTGIRDATSALAHIFSPSGIRRYSDTVTNPGRGNDNDRFISPIGAGRIAAQAVDAGLSEALLFLVMINIFVGVFNLVPLLPLDGGHVAIATYEKIASMIRRRRVQVDVSRLLPITAAVMALLILIGLSALYLDIVHPVRNPF